MKSRFQVEDAISNGKDRSFQSKKYKIYFHVSYTMKQIAVLLPMAFFLLMIQGCQSGSEANTEESQTNFSEKKANEFAPIEKGPVYSFTVVPDKYDNCRGVFAQTEDELATDHFIFATDLRQSCVIAIDGRLLQIEIVAKRTANLTAQFYKYEGKGYTIDLEIRQTEVVDQNLKKVRGQLKIMGENGYRNVFYIMGEVDC